MSRTGNISIQEYTPLGPSGKRAVSVFALQLEDQQFKPQL